MFVVCWSLACLLFQSNKSFTVWYRIFCKWSEQTWSIYIWKSGRIRIQTEC